MLSFLLVAALASFCAQAQEAPAPPPAPPAPDAAQDQQQAQPPESQQPAPAPAAAPAPAQTPPADAGHKSLFKNLRFEEDWSALKEAETKTDHWLPGIKAIELDGEGDWSIGFGGQIRLQSKSEQNRNLLGGPVPHNNDFNLLRVREYADIRYRKDFRAFIEMISAGIHGNDAAPTPIDRQDWDMLNGFVELLGDDTLGRLGRFEMQYGAQRLISPLEWANTRRTFQGGLFRAKAGASTTDVFVTRPVVVDPHQNDDESHERWFSGVYNVWKVGESTNLDLYALALNDQDPTAPVTVPAGGPPTFDGDVYTAGGRYSGKLGAADYDFEAAKQFGNRNGLDVDAYMWTAVGGFTLADVLFSPRFAVDVDYASGDDSAGDGDYETFNQLYPLGHAYFGYIDLIGRQNIVQVMPSMTLKTTSTTTFRASWSDFELASESDFLYNSAGGIAAGQSAATLDTGDEVGQEVDLTVAWKPASLAPHSEFLFGYSWFDPGSFVNGWGDGEDANLLYAQYTFTF